MNDRTRQAGTCIALAALAMIAFSVWAPSGLSGSALAGATAQDAKANRRGRYRSSPPWRSGRLGD